MKKIIAVSFLLLIVYTSVLKAQNPSFSVQPSSQCSNATNSYSFFAAIVLSNPAITSYSWTVLTSPGSCTPVATSVNPSGIPSNTAINVVMPCCGQFTVACSSYINSVFVGTLQVAFQPNPNAPAIGKVYCPSAPLTVMPLSQNACMNAPTTLTASGSSTNYTVMPSGVVSSTNPIIITPTATTTYSVLGTNTDGCVISATAGVTVQGATVTVPATQTLCTGEPVCFTATANALNVPDYSSGTTVSAYNWMEPNTTSLIPGASLCTTASSGIYSVVVEHMGAAGTCSIQSSVLISTLASIPVTMSPSAPFACPGNSINLVANSQQTVVSSYTWTTPNPSTVIGKTLNVSAASPGIYTVNLNYYGCTGSNTVALGIKQLTVNLLSSAASSSVCPGNAITFSANSGGGSANSYTFSGTPLNTGIPVLLSTTSNSTISYSPALAELPIKFCVALDSAGCIADTCISLGLSAVSPTITSSSPSVCPGNAITFSANSAGGSANSYTFSFTPVNTGIPILLSTTSNSTISYSPALAELPMKFCVALDSAGCTADTCINIGLSAINPTITSSSPSVCASAHFTLSASGGSGTNYTFLAPLGSAPPSMTVVGNTAIHSSTLAPSLLTYTIVADSLGCKAEVLFTQTVNLCITSLREETANRDFSIYPNPVQHNFTLETGFPGIITVTDITGRIIIEKEVTERKTLFNSESLSPGLYSVSYKTSTHLFSTKIVK